MTMELAQQYGPKYQDPGGKEALKREPVPPQPDGRARSHRLLQGERQSLGLKANTEEYQSQSSEPTGSSKSSSEPSITKPLPAAPYHVLEKRQKRVIVYLISMAAFFSPLSSNIYLPAVDQIAKDLHVTVGAVLLSITVYMVVQGLAPSFWGALADSRGRRQTLIYTLTSYLIANLGLGLTPNFSALMVFRGLQAFGSSATIAIGSGIISDLAEPAERGGFVGVFSGMRMLGQSVGPVVGGTLTQFLGFRAIFYFLLILGAVVVTIIILILPETLRSIAGDGSVRLRGFLYRPVLPLLVDEPTGRTEADLGGRAAFSWAAVFQPLKSLLAKDVFVTLFFGSIVYAVWSMMTASTTKLFKEHYNLSNVQLGLAFVPSGLGCVVGSIATGVLLDHDYKKTEKEYRKRRKLPPSTKINPRDFSDFPVERARLRNLWWVVMLFIGTLAAFGFSLGTDIDLPFLLQFIISATATSVFNINSALVIDLFPGKSASATAMNNLMRCSVGAVGVGVTEPLLSLVGPKISFAILAGITAVFSSLAWAQSRYGMRWRMEREKKRDHQQAAV
ncbi:uncharacterized protein A1O5_03210 [Cladophialophora psammophila CBS 110553]|uniref:Major facilitator superfamily (MFS) profile domain-containing protein n=1 Tax=Cladophialophora psammophila CBS 110553 TaxID=1182543 RepID=W9X804_9EURO|nr:uncharacterized protein A1O5_03210 [Cladophialophora psammophila CBS 110553]EXJ73450.1 hypothetical protein A1O5_03210 [Cladophialophora psammophila CBS 110553]